MTEGLLPQEQFDKLGPEHIVPGGSGVIGFHGVAWE